MNKDNISQTRRSFFHLLAAEVISFVQEIKGIPQMRLNELHLLSDDIIKKMVPVFTKDVSIQIRENRILKYNKKTESYCEMRHLDKHEAFIIKFFHGEYPIEKIALQLSIEFELEKDVAYQKIKILFTDLAKCMIIYPKEAYNLKED